MPGIHYITSVSEQNRDFLFYQSQYRLRFLSKDIIPSNIFSCNIFFGIILQNVLRVIDTDLTVTVNICCLDLFRSQLHIISCNALGISLERQLSIINTDFTVAGHITAYRSRSS